MQLLLCKHSLLFNKWEGSVVLAAGWEKERKLQTSALSYNWICFPMHKKGVQPNGLKCVRNSLHDVQDLPHRHSLSWRLQGSDIIAWFSEVTDTNISCSNSSDIICSRSICCVEAPGEHCSRGVKLVATKMLFFSSSFFCVLNLLLRMHLFCFLPLLPPSKEQFQSNISRYLCQVSFKLYGYFCHRHSTAL